MTRPLIPGLNIYGEYQEGDLLCSLTVGSGDEEMTAHVWASNPKEAVDRCEDAFAGTFWGRFVELDPEWMQESVRKIAREQQSRNAMKAAAE